MFNIPLLLVPVWLALAPSYNRYFLPEVGALVHKDAITAAVAAKPVEEKAAEEVKAKAEAEALADTEYAGIIAVRMKDDFNEGEKKKFKVVQVEVDAQTLADFNYRRWMYDLKAGKLVATPEELKRPEPPAMPGMPK